MITTESQLALTQDERDYLAALLEKALKNTRIEEHRTRDLIYREHVIRDKEVIRSLLAKLGRPNE